MSVDSIKNKISGITDGGQNTAFEMRAVLTDIADTFSASTSATLDYVTSNGNVTTNDISVSAITTEYIQLDINASNTGFTPTQGTIQWNALEDTVDLYAHGVTYQLGQEISPMGRNNTGSLIPNGSPVMFAGSLGNSGRILISPAIADGSIPSSYVLGVTTEDISNNEDGHVTTFGKVREIDTTGAPYGEVWNDGDVLYVSPFTGGTLTNIKPSAPNPQIFAAVVVHTHGTNGTLFVRPSWRGKFTDLDDVDGTPLTVTGQIPVWDNDAQVFDFTSNVNNFFTGTTSDDFTTGATFNSSNGLITFTRQSGSTYNVDIGAYSGGTGGAYTYSGTSIYPTQAQNYTITSDSNVIAGGQNNTVSGNTSYSFIAAGEGNIAKHNNTFILGSNITTVSANTTYTEHLVVGGIVTTDGYTVATLPTGEQGMRAFVTDANSTTFASVVAGGGSNVVPVFHNGTNWIIA